MIFFGAVWILRLDVFKNGGKCGGFWKTKTLQGQTPLPLRIALGTQFMHTGGTPVLPDVDGDVGGMKSPLTLTLSRGARGLIASLRSQ